MVNKALSTAALLTAIFVITSCSGSGSSGSSSPATNSAPATAPSSSASQPATFRSATYGYTVTLPAGWTGTQAVQAWDIHAGFGLNVDSFQADQFRSASTAAAYVVAARWKQDLGAFARFWISDNAHYHESCPPKPTTRYRVTIGSQPGVLLAYNCGILVNIAVTVDHGVGYNFSLVDDSVASSTDPTDHATFLTILRSVQFPD